MKLLKNYLHKELDLYCWSSTGHKQVGVVSSLFSDTGDYNMKLSDILYNDAVKDLDYGKKNILWVIFTVL